MNLEPRLDKTLHTPPGAKIDCPAGTRPKSVQALYTDSRNRPISVLASAMSRYSFLCASSAFSVFMNYRQAALSLGLAFRLMLTVIQLLSSRPAYARAAYCTPAIGMVHPSAQSRKSGS